MERLAIGEVGCFLVKGMREAKVSCLLVVVAGRNLFGVCFRWCLRARVPTRTKSGVVLL